MKLISIGATVAAVTFLLSTRVIAHHAFAAEFDASKPFEVEGEVTKIKWVNPHSWLYFDVKSPDGTVVSWGVEFGTPALLLGRGLTKNDLTVGNIVRIKGFRSRVGDAIGYSSVLTLPDGRSFQTGGAADVPAETAAAK